MSERTLYGCWRSSASHRLQIGLRLKQLPFTYKPVSLDAGEQHSPWYRAINPHGEVPTLVVDGTAWTQSLAILESLDEQHPDQGIALLPRDADQRRQCRAIAEHINSSLQPLLLPARLRQPLLQAADSDVEPALRDAIAQGVQNHQRQALAHLNAWLSNVAGPFCLGTDPSLADVMVVAHLESAMRLGLDLNPLRRLSDLHSHCMGLEAFADAAPERLADAPGQPKAATGALPDAFQRRSQVLSHKEPAPALADYLGQTANAPIPGLDSVRQRTLTNFGVVASKMTALDGCLLLRWLCRSRRVQRVLEVGVFTGSSSLALLDGLDGQGELVAIDCDARFTAVAEEAWSSIGKRQQVTLIHGDGCEQMLRLQGEPRFDLIYIDADNNDYVRQLDLALTLLHRGGLIVFDNVLWRGQVVNPGHDTSAQSLDHLNRLLQSRRDLTSTVLSLSDGLALVEPASESPAGEPPRP